MWAVHFSCVQPQAMALLPGFQQIWQELHTATISNPFLICLLFFFSILFVLKFNGGNTKLKLPPSPPKLPIIGNLHQLGTLPHRSLRDLSKKYGHLILMHLGQAPTLVISSAELAKEIIQTNDIIFSNRPRITAGKLLLYDFEDIVFASYGKNWREARKICVMELLNLKRVQSFQYIREEEVAVLIGKIRCRSCSNGAFVNLTEMLLATSNNITSRCVLGKKCEDEDGYNRFGELSRRILVELMAVCVGDFFPYLGWVDVLTGVVPRMKATIKEFNILLDQTIEEHKRVLNKDQSEMDLLDIFLQLQRDDNLEFDLTPDKLKAILLDMFVGGTDTSSTTMEWAMAELIRNPTTLKKAQEEVRRVVGTKSKIQETDINQMGYLKCVIKEALRLHSPIPLLIPRETSASVKLGGYDIPPKTRVFVNVWAIQRDSKLWDKAEEFIPERFENNPVDFKGHDFQFLPFGGGRRGCPGIAFGVATTEYVLANLLYWFDWALPNDASPENLDMNELSGLTVSRKVPFHLLPSCYSP